MEVTNIIQNLLSRRYQSSEAMSMHVCALRDGSTQLRKGRYTMLDEMSHHTRDDTTFPLTQLNPDAVRLLDLWITVEEAETQKRQTLLNLMEAGHYLGIAERHLVKLQWMFFDTLNSDASFDFHSLKPDHFSKGTCNIANYSICQRLTRACPIDKVRTLHSLNIFDPLAYSEKYEAIAKLLEAPFIEGVIFGDPNKIDINKMQERPDEREVRRRRGTGDGPGQFSPHGIGDAGVSIIADAIVNGALGHLIQFDLRWSKLTDAGVKTLASVIASGSMRNLRTLTFGMNQIKDAGMRELMNAIAQGYMSDLESLGFSTNDIGDAGISALADVIASGSLRALRSIYLDGNDISYVGVSTLLSCLDTHLPGNIETLYLVRNRIGDEGMKALASAIESGYLKNLVTLGLSANKIGEAGMNAFFRAIANAPMTSLTELFLAGNDIGDAGYDAFADAISSGSLPSLQILHIKDNPGVNEHPQLGAACENRGIRYI